MIEGKKHGIKIGSAEEVYWKDVKCKCEESILAHKRNLIIDNELLKLAKIKIEENKLE